MSDIESADMRPVIPAWTDYPFEQLGDKPHCKAPIRKCGIMDYDGCKYLTICVDGKLLDVKSGYVYQAEGRLGEQLCFNHGYLAKCFNRSA